MRRTLTAFALAGVLLAGGMIAQQRNQQDIDLQAAIRTETVDGDLKRAIKQYEAIVAKYGKDHGVAVQALLHMAESYQKLGDSESHKIYERIVRDYADQKEAASVARGRLASAAGTLIKRQLCSDCGDSEADLSPDGRLMVFTDWDSGDLAIRDMSTEKVKRLMAKSGTWDDSSKDPDAFGESPVLSPDLRQIVYFWEVGNKEDNHQLRIMPNEPGGKARVLADSPHGENYYEPAAWFPDGKSVLVTLQKPDKTWQLARVSVSDGAVKPIKSVEWRFFRTVGRPNLSPDGQFIVYSALATNPSKLPPIATDPTDRHIWVLAADGSSETEIVKTAGINQNPFWTADGKHILFTSDRLGKVDLWSIAIQNGRAVGSASLVSPGIENIEAIGMHAGSYYYTQRQIGAEYVSIVDYAQSGNAPGRLAHATESFVGIRPTWSPDGKFIAFKRHHPGSTDAYDLVVHSLETGDEKTYLTSLGTTGQGAALWFHDGKAMMTGIKRADGSGAFYRIDLKSGDFKELATTPVPSALSADDKILYAQRRDPKDSANVPDRIAAVDLSTGQERPVLTLPTPGAVNPIFLSPDGLTLVFKWPDQKTKMTRFARVNVDGTGYRDIYTIAQKDESGNMTLTKDGRSILFEKSHDDKWQLMLVPIDGGEPKFTGLEIETRNQNLDLSPDGSRIAFSNAKSVQELWALDNVLSVLK